MTTTMTVNEIKKRFWDGIVAINPYLYTEERLDKLVTFAIHKLTEGGMKATFEDVCVLVHKLFPEKFALTSWPEHPDLIRIDNTLRLDCQHSSFVTGNRVKGYRLTPLGKNTAEDIQRVLVAGKTNTKGKRKKNSLQGQRRNIATRLIREAGQSGAFEKFTTGKVNEIRKFDVCDLLHGTLNTDEKVLKNNLIALSQYASDLEPINEYHDLSSSVLKVLKFIDSKWEDLMNAY